jgi:hypothetical protein
VLNNRVWVGLLTSLFSFVFFLPRFIKAAYTTAAAAAIIEDNDVIIHRNDGGGGGGVNRCRHFRHACAKVSPSLFLRRFWQIYFFLIVDRLASKVGEKLQLNSKNWKCVYFIIIAGEKEKKSCPCPPPHD